MLSLLLLLFSRCSLLLVFSSSLFQPGSSLLKFQLPQQSRVWLKPTELFMPSLPVLISSVAKVAFVALAIQSVYSGSEIVIRGSRGVFSIVIMFHGSLYSGATPSQRSTSLEGSKQCVSSSSAKKLKLNDYVCFTQTFMTSSPQFEDLQAHSFSVLLLCKPAISGYCSHLLSWTTSVDQWLMCGFNKNLWLRRGNVDGRSLCLTSTTASLSPFVQLIYLNADVKVTLTTLIHSQQLLSFLYSLVLFSNMSNAATDSEMKISSKKTHVLGIVGLFYAFDAVYGARSPRSSEIRRQPENSTSSTIIKIQSVARTLLILEDCSPVALTEKANQLSSCRGHERSLPSFLLFVEVNISIKNLLHERYFALGFKAKEYCRFPNRLLSCVMVCLRPGRYNEAHPNEIRGFGAFNVTTYSDYLRV